MELSNFLTKAIYIGFLIFLGLFIVLPPIAIALFISLVTWSFSLFLPVFCTLLVLWCIFLVLKIKP